MKNRGSEDEGRNPKADQKKQNQEGDPKGSTFRRLGFLPLLPLSETSRRRRVAEFLGVEIEHVKADAMLHFALAQIVQTRLPLAILLEVLRNPSRKEDVTGITAIHHPLRHVDPGAGDVGPPTHVGHFAHRAAMNSHSHRDLRMLLQRFGNLERATRRFLGAVAKDSAIPSPVGSLTSCSLGCLAHLRGRQHDVSELA